MEWKEINGYSKYSISETGLIKNNKTGKLLKLCVNRDGYICVGLFCDETKKQRKPYVHRLVASMFIENNYNYPQVDHIDRNPLNNRFDNLRWVTPKENVDNRGIFNKTGLYYDEEKNKWNVQFKNKNELILLGSYDYLDEAVLILKEYK